MGDAHENVGLGLFGHLLKHRGRLVRIHLRHEKRDRLGVLRRDKAVEDLFGDVGDDGADRLFACTGDVLEESGSCLVAERSGDNVFSKFAPVNEQGLARFHHVAEFAGDRELSFAIDLRHRHKGAADTFDLRFRQVLQNLRCEVFSHRKEGYRSFFSV